MPPKRPNSRRCGTGGSADGESGPRDHASRTRDDPWQGELGEALSRAHDTDPVGDDAPPLYDAVDGAGRIDVYART